jgi:hypothetical protein
METGKNIKKKVKISSRGGARPNSGRPAGSKNKINKATIQTVIDTLYDKTGRVYEDLLIEDFLKARMTSESLTLKYHYLLASKLMPNLSEVTVEEIGDQVDAKRAAFAEAIRALTPTNTETK